MIKLIPWITLPFILPVLFVACMVAACALVAVFVLPMWWTQCQIFNFVFYGTSTWICFK